MRKVRNLLGTQIKNPFLVENKECLDHWRDALSTSRVSLDVAALSVNSPEMEDLFIEQAGSIWDDVHYVWQKLVLESKSSNVQDAP